MYCRTEKNYISKINKRRQDLSTNVHFGTRNNKGNRYVIQFLRTREHYNIL